MINEDGGRSYQKDSLIPGMVRRRTTFEDKQKLQEAVEEIQKGLERVDDDGVVYHLTLSVERVSDNLYNDRRQE